CVRVMGVQLIYFDYW
nr:immunoglobulin heavy chain junction region [Macaca mulatta]MOV36810.1 immunoglobulin heavy chain junction region [Macaca mulatta]